MAVAFGAAAGATDAEPSASPALLHAAPGLDERFPVSIAGQPLEIRTWTGPEWLARFDPATEPGVRALDAAERLFSATTASPDALSVRTAILQPSAGNVVAVEALQVEGVDAHRLVEVATAIVHPEIERPWLELDWISDRTVFLARDLAMPGSYPVTVYADDDTVWFVNASGPLRGDLLAQLPPPRPMAEAAFDLADVFPTVLGGHARDLFTLRSGGLGWGTPLVSLAEVELDGFAEDVVLMTGADWYELITASGLAVRFGLLPSVNALQVAGSDEDMMRRVRDEILLPRMGGGEAQSETVRMAGRELLRVTSQAATVYLYVSGDTIWWLEAEDPDLLEVVEQLP